MSFILDALKKSENDRQRQNGPAVFEMKVAKPKTGLPMWAFALAGLLLINLGVVIWLLVRSPSRGEAIAAMPPPIAGPAVISVAPAPAAAQIPITPAQPTDEPVAIDTAPPPVAAGNVPPEAINPEDYEPAVEPPENPQSGVRRGTIEGLQNYEQVASAPGNGLPDLRLDLHVYAAKPPERFVFLNMHRLREGDSLPEGIRVESITPDGAVLSFRGTRFVLERD